MDLQSFIDSSLFAWVVLPLLIFLARICDQTLATIRIMFLSQGNKIVAPILGFFEILIWLLAVRQIFSNLSNVTTYIAYAAGFAAGNYIGIVLEEKIAIGKRIIRIISQKDASKLFLTLAEKGYGVTNVPAESSGGNVNVLYAIVDRSHLDDIIILIEELNPGAFYSVQSIISAKGEFLERKKKGLFRRMNIIMLLRRNLSGYWKRKISRKSR